MTEKSSMDYESLYGSGVDKFRAPNKSESQALVEESFFFGGPSPETCNPAPAMDEDPKVYEARIKAHAEKVSRDAHLFSSRTDVFSPPMTPVQILENQKKAFQMHVSAFNAWDSLDPKKACSHLRSALFHYEDMHHLKLEGN